MAPVPGATPRPMSEEEKEEMARMKEVQDMMAGFMAQMKHK